MQWTRVDDDLSWISIPLTPERQEELAEAGFRTVVEVRGPNHRRLDAGDLARVFAVRHLAVGGWSERVFEEFLHVMQTGEPGPVVLAVHDERDAMLLAWVWRGLREQRPFTELKDRANREGVVLPLGAWRFLAARLSPGQPSPIT